MCRTAALPHQSLSGPRLCDSMWSLALPWAACGALRESLGDMCAPTIPLKLEIIVSTYITPKQRALQQQGFRVFRVR